MVEKTILLVDDEELILSALGRELRTKDFQVSVAANGEEALWELEQRHYDLILSDLVMDGLDGLQVLKQAKKRDPEICVIIITAFGDMNSAIDALRLGADDYVLKPCAVDDLVFRIDRCLEKQELKKKLKLYEKILSICSVCNKIRDDRGNGFGKGMWMKVDEYLTKTTNIMMSHSYCPECFSKAMTDEDAADL